MMAGLLRVAGLALSLLLVQGVLSASPSMATLRGAADVDWDTNGTTSKDWRQHPATGVWTQVPVGVPEDPYDYKFQRGCKDFPTQEGGNCAIQDVRCTEGDNGRSVNWYRSLRGLEPPAWAYFEGPTCIYDEKPESILERIAATIETELRNSPVRPAVVTAQPNPHTLLGAETNFFAEAAEQQFDITILGQKVHIVATPVEYTWNYGDGSVVGPQTSAGGSLPQDRWGEKTRTSHVYTQTGDFNVVLTAHFRGTYSVNNGPPLPIPGQGQFSSAPLTTSVWRSITRHYADNCLVNPQGDGCPGMPVR